MNATILAHAAYTSSATPIKTHSGTEYDAFARITLRLKKNTRNNNFTEYVQALHDNRELWTILAVDVADGENNLTEQLRAQIFYLAEFTRLHTSKVMSGEASPDALIDINTAMMRGLRAQEVAS